MGNLQAPAAVLDLRQQIEEHLERQVFSSAASTKLLRDAMRHGLLAPSTRIRAVTALATADALGCSRASVLPLAAAIEMIHAHALMHAGLPAMGGGAARADKPATHVVFGQDVALLAGDALFAEAISLVLHEQHGEPARVLAAAAELMRAVGVGGLVGALYADRGQTSELDDDRLRQAYELRAGSLLASAVATVLIVTGETGPAAAPLRRFGAATGVLSQIVDDILDATPDPGRGDVRCDGAAGRVRSTYVSAFGLARARELARESHSHASAALAEVRGDHVALQSVADFILRRLD